MSASRLRLNQIRTDGGTQSRSQVDPDAIERYRLAYVDLVELPPIEVVHDGRDHWLWDGFQRVKAAYLARLTTLPTNIRQGTQRDAILLSCGANASHGLTRNAADVRRAVERLISDPAWGQWNNCEIARRCSCGEHLVRNVRAELSSPGAKMRKIERSGETYEMDTSRIGRRSADEDEIAEQDAAIDEMADLTSAERAELKEQLRREAREARQATRRESWKPVKSDGKRWFGGRWDEDLLAKMDAAAVVLGVDRLEAAEWLLQNAPMPQKRAG